MPAATADRNLLFGIVALQLDFIGRDDLLAAMNAWALEKGKSLGQILVEQGKLAVDDLALLETLVEKHLSRHGNDPHQSLAAVMPPESVREGLRLVADPDVQASLIRIPAEPPTDTDATGPFVSTSGGGPGMRYRVLRPHARGGLGQVSVAFDEELHREVALKEILERHAANSESQARFLLEAEVTGGLEHPGIVPVYGLGRYPDGRPFYAMRFVRGDSLKDAIERFHRPEERAWPAGERAVELRRLLRRFLDVCNAIEYAHSRGVLHRDLKPGNILVGKYGETLVVDWGLAKVLGRSDPKSTEGALRTSVSGESTLTMTGSAIGTPSFMSPEQAAGKLDDLGPASDVYSLGAMLYCLLTGHPPFEKEDVGEVLRKVQSGDCRRPRAINPEVPTALESVCLKAMAVHPADRYQSPRALADDLEHWLADEPVSSYREPVSQRLARWRRRHPTLVAVSLVVLVTLVGCGVVGFNLVRRGQEQARALGQVDALIDAEPAAVPALLVDLANSKEAVSLRLRLKWRDTALTDRQRLRVGLALADDPAVREKLIDLATETDDPADTLLVRDALRPHAAHTVPAMWAKLGDPEYPPFRRFRLLLVLAELDPENPAWVAQGPFAVERLLSINPLYLWTCQRALAPARAHLVAPLREVCRGTAHTFRGTTATVLLAEYAADRPDVLTDVILDLPQPQYPVVLLRLQAHRDAAVRMLRAELAKTTPTETDWPARNALARRQAQAAVTLLQLDHPDEAWPMLVGSPDPSRRTHLIHLLGRLRSDPTPIIRRLQHEPNPSARAALILSLGEFAPELLPPERRAPLVAFLLQRYRDDPDPGVHSAIDWLLRHGKKGPIAREIEWGQRAALEAIDRELERKPPGAKGWYVEAEGHTLAMIRGPKEFMQGSPDTDPERRASTENPYYRRRIPRSFAIGIREVSIAQFKRFMDANKRSWTYSANYSPDPEGGAIAVTWYDAAEYCNWLSKEAGIPEEEWVYPATIRDGMKLPENFLKRKGYRLPTEAEWEFACRAGTTSPRFFGHAPGLMDEYAWWYKNSEDRSWPGGMLKPNDLGLFDTYGGVMEWCQDRLRAYPFNADKLAVDDVPGLLDLTVLDNSLFARVMRGGSFGSRLPSLRSAARQRDRAGARFDSVGLRVARTFE